MNHVVQTLDVSVTKFEGGLQLLHEAEDSIVWLEAIATIIRCC